MAAKAKHWTLREVHSLPDDGNKYELVRGDLLVTPPPSEAHENVLAQLSRVLHAYVAANALGRVYHPRAVVRFEGSEVEPDLMVRRPTAPGRRDWDDAPTPLLVIEVVSGSTRRRDHLQKRELYLAAGVAEYWIVDPEAKSVRIVKPGVPDDVRSDELTWAPSGVAEPLRIDVREILGDG